MYLGKTKFWAEREARRVGGFGSVK